jgi:mannose-6-phosphate isomerase-like protein (cupin superfamily)
MENRVVNLKYTAQSLQEHWSPKVVAELDDSYVKVAKLLGSLTWHNHEEEDELFLVLSGHLRIEFKTHVVDLHEGDSYVVPKGEFHNPVADSECLIMLIEKKTTAHTGNVKTQRTKSIEEQLR